MPATTTLLGLVTPTQGTLSGTWGDTVNYGISDYVDIAIAGTLSFAGDGAITLANTTGSSAGNAITSTTAQYMVIRITGTQTVTKVITGPSYSKLYMVDHAGATSAVTFKASGQTGVSVAVGEKCFVYYNGTDYVKVASSVADGVTTIDFGSTGLTPSTATSGAVSVAGTLVVANGGTGQTSYTDGQLLIGNTTGNTLTKTTLTAGSNITITNGSGAITIAASSGATAATPTVLGTVYGKQSTSGGTPYLTAYGYSAGTLTTGIENVAFGVQALELNVTGTNNTMLGTYAGSNNTNSFNVAVGSHALRNNTSGANNIAIGYATLVSNSTNSNNVGVGHQALNSSTASNNTAVGYQASYSNTTANGNTAVGYRSLKANTTGSANSSFGYDSLLANTTGYSLVGVGESSLQSNTTGYRNVCVGHSAGQGITTGFSNIFIGYQAATAGTYSTTTSQSIIIGDQARASADGGSYEIIIGNNIVGKGSSTAFINGNGGGSYNGANTTTWATISDQRLKKNIVDNNTGLDKITTIQVRNFEYRLPEEVTELPQDQAIQKSGVQLGVIAQELQAVLPDCVKLESTGVLRVDADNLTWYMINAIKELKAEVDNLKSQLQGN